ncbi:substrate-binding periplasmic protein [Magnetococcales bacterium HHB-1]
MGFILLLSSPPFAGIAQSQENQTIQSIRIDRSKDLWFNPDGILKTIFKRAKISAQITKKPFQRGYLDVVQGYNDLFVGGLRLQAKEFLFPRWHLYLASFSVLSHKAIQKNRKIEDKRQKTYQDNLRKKRIVAQQGFEFYYFQDLGTLNIQWIEVKKISACLAFLKSNRADYCMDSTEVLKKLINTQAQQPSSYQLDKIFSEPVYPVFSNTPRSKEILRIYDTQLDAMVKEGTLATLFISHGLPVPRLEDSKLASNPSMDALGSVESNPHLKAPSF